MLGPVPGDEAHRRSPGTRSTPPSGNPPARIFGPGQVGEHADRPADARRRPSRTVGEPVEVLVERAVAEVEAHDVDAGAHQRLERRRVVAWPGRAWRRSSCAGSRLLSSRATTPCSVAARRGRRVPIDGRPCPTTATRPPPARVPRRLAVAVARRAHVGRPAPDGGGFVARRRARRRGRRSADAGLRRPRRRADRLAAPAGAGAAARAARRRPHRLARPAGQAAPRRRPWPAGASSASRSTAACCSTAGSTATSASPGGSCSPTARDALVDVAEPIARVPQLAIHLDRDVNERGLVLDRQAHMRPVWATALGTSRSTRGSPSAPARRCPAAWELCLYDVQPAAVLGADRSLLASGRLDNLVSCWAATTRARRRRAGRRTSR